MTDSAPNPVARRDVAAVIGLLATLEGEIMAGDVGPHLAERLSRRLARDGLLDPDEAGTAALCRALSELNHRLRYTLGESPQPPGSV